MCNSFTCVNSSKINGLRQQPQIDRIRFELSIVYVASSTFPTILILNAFYYKDVLFD